jgi:hypothetical protein
LYALVAALFGNTPAVYLSMLAGIGALNICLAYMLIRRAGDRWTAVAISVVMLAVLPIPGAIAGAFTSSPILVLERTLLLVVALTWRPPAARGFAPSLAVGLALGIWQGVKFGGAVVAGGAVLLLDALYLMSTGFSLARMKAWTRSFALTAIAFVAIEIVWVSHAFLTQPYDVAVDVVWPSYMFHAYWVVTPDIRWPTWGGWRLMVAQYLLPLTAGLLGGFGLVGWLRTARAEVGRERRAGDNAGSVFVPLCFYAVGCVGYFNHIYHFQQFPLGVDSRSGMAAAAFTRLRQTCDRARVGTGTSGRTTKCVPDGVSCVDGDREFAVRRNHRHDPKSGGESRIPRTIREVRVGRKADSLRALWLWLALRLRGTDCYSEHVLFRA